MPCVLGQLPRVRVDGPVLHGGHIMTAVWADGPVTRWA